MLASRRILRVVVAVAAVTALAGCATPPAEVPAPSPTSASPSPTAEASTSAFDVECADLASVIDAVGLFDTAVTLSEPEATDELVWNLYPLDSEVISAGGLACSSLSAPHVSVSALANASADFTSALEAAAAASEDSPIGVLPHLPSDVGDEGVTTCRDAGAGGLCTWSVRADDIWLVVELFPLSLEDLVFPPDRPDGWAQQPYPVAGSQPILAVEAIVDAVVASRTEGPATVAMTTPRCVEVIAASIVAEQFDVDGADVTVGAIEPSAVARSVASTAGHALPYYAAERVGWDRCNALWQTADGNYLSLTLVTRPVPESGAVDVPTSCGPHPDGPDALCSGAVTVNGQYRVAQLDGPVPAEAESQLLSVLTG